MGGLRPRPSRRAAFPYRPAAERSSAFLPGAGQLPVRKTDAGPRAHEHRDQIYGGIRSHSGSDADAGKKQCLRDENFEVNIVLLLQAVIYRRAGESSCRKKSDRMAL